MKITIESTPLEQTAAGAVIVPVFEGRREDRFGAGDLCESGEIAGKPLELTLLHHAPGVAATRVLLAGVGKQERFNPAELRKAVGAAVRNLKSKSVKRIAFGVAPEYGATPKAILFTDFDFRFRTAAPTAFRNSAGLNLSCFPTPARSTRVAATPGAW